MRRASLAIATVAAAGCGARAPEWLPKGPPLRLDPTVAARWTKATAVQPSLGCVYDPLASAPYVWTRDGRGWKPFDSWAPDGAVSLDLDADGQPETIWVDDRAYPARLRIVDGHDPLLIDRPAPIADARDLRVLGTSDLDGDGRREIVVSFWNTAAWEVAVVEYQSDQPVMEVECAPYRSR